MKNKAIIIKSKGRRYFRISLALIIALVLFYYGITDNRLSLIIFGSFTLFIVIIEVIVYGKTTVELTSEYLKARYSTLSGLINDEYIFKLSDIQASYYKKKTYDKGMLIIYPLFELLFPSNDSYLIIHTLDGKTKEIPLNANKKEVNKIMTQLPERVPK